MKLALTLAPLAFLSGMSLQSQLDEPATQEKEVRWVDWGEDPMTNPEFLAAMAAAGTPGKAHASIARSAGEWTVAQKMYMAPGAPAIPSEARSSSRMILGGRVLLEEYSSEVNGMPMEGLLLLGYDNLEEEYWSVWLDSFTTWPSYARGHEDAEGALILEGELKDISTPEGRPFHQRSWSTSEDQHRAEIFDTAPGGESFKMMEFTYDRVKDAK